MMSIVENSDTPEEVIDVFDFVLSDPKTKEGIVDIKNINNKALSFFKEKYSSLNKNEIDEVLKRIDKYSFNDVSNYVDCNDSHLDELILILSLFKSKLLSVLYAKSTTGHKKIVQLKRKTIPSTEAYTYMGHNHLEIEPTGRNYGLSLE